MGGSKRGGMKEILLKPIGVIKSPYKALEEAPKQGKERRETSVLVLNDKELVNDLKGSKRLRVLYWMHKAGRDVLWSNRRNRGIFATRSPERPNPIGVAAVEVLDMRGRQVRVRHLDAVDGTPVIGIFPLPGEG